MMKIKEEFTNENKSNIKDYDFLLTKKLYIYGNYPTGDTENIKVVLQNFDEKKPVAVNKYKKLLREIKNKYSIR